MKRALVLLILVLITSPVAVRAQPQVIWHRSLGFTYQGEPMTSQGVMIGTDETGLYLLGVIGNQSSPISFFLAKFNFQGDLLWQVARPLTDKYYRLTLAWPVVMDITDSHVYVAAAFWWLSEGISSIYLMKVDKDTGAIEYAGLKLLQPGDPGIKIYPAGIEVRREGDTNSIYLVGDASKPYSHTIFVAKMVDEGRTFHLAWSKMIEHRFDLAPYGQIPRSVIFDDGIYVTGDYAPVTFASPRVLLVKFNWKGDPVWAFDIRYTSSYYSQYYLSGLGFLPSQTTGKLQILGSLTGPTPTSPTRMFLASINRDGTGGEVFMADALNLSYLLSNLHLGMRHPITGIYLGSNPTDFWSFVGSFNGTGLESMLRFEGEDIPFLSDALSRGGALYITGIDRGEINSSIIPTEMDFGLTPVDKPMLVPIDVRMEAFSLKVIEPALTGYDPNMVSYMNDSTQGAFLAKLGEKVNVSILVDPTDAGTTDPPVGNYTFLKGGTIVVRAQPSQGYAFDHWEVDGSEVGGSSELTLTLESNHRIVAHFKEVEEKEKEVIVPPSPCQLAFMGFPSDFGFKAGPSDERFNEDLLSGMRRLASTQRLHRMVILGGPAVVPFNWGSLGIKFLRIEGSYKGLRTPSGEVLISHYGEEDHAVIYRDCSRGVIRIAGITRFGTRAGLMWLLNNVGTFYSGSSLILVSWRDLDGNGEVELWEIEVEDL